MKPKYKKQTVNTPQNQHVNLDLEEKLKEKYQIKECFVKLNFMNIDNSAMDETSSPQVEPKEKKRPGRKPKISLAAKRLSAPPKPESAEKSKDESVNEKNESTDNANKSEKTEKQTPNERKQAKKAQIEAIIASGGRGKAGFKIFLL